jgi:hypothetical protein
MQLPKPKPNPPKYHNDHCPKCKAQLLRGTIHQNGMHVECYRAWLWELEEELRGTRVKGAAA